jgi:hypothetical protein
MKRVFITATAILMIFSCIPAYAQMPSYTELTKLLIDLKGWSAQDATGMNMSGPMGEMVNAVREYEKDGLSISAQLLVGGAAQGTWAPFEAGYTMDTPEIFIKTMDVSGHRIGINHEKKEKTGAIVVQLDTKINPGIFVLSYEGMSYSEALDIAKKFSWDSMKSAIK